MYDLPEQQTVSVTHDFSSGETFTIKGPPGKKGTLKDIRVAATTTFAPAGANVQVGVTGTADQNADLAIGTLAGNANLTARETLGAIKDGALAADTDVLITFGATTAGAANVDIQVEWY